MTRTTSTADPAVDARTGRLRTVLRVALRPSEPCYRAGGHLAPEHAEGRITFEEFLAERRGPAAAG